MNHSSKNKISSFSLQQKEVLEEIKKEWLELVTSSGKSPNFEIDQDIDWLYWKSGLQKPKVMIANSFQEFIEISEKYLGITAVHPLDIMNPNIDRKFLGKLVCNANKMTRDCFQDNAMSELIRIEQFFSNKIRREVLVPLKSAIPHSIITHNPGFGLSEEFWMITCEFLNRLGYESDGKKDFFRYCNMMKSGVWYAVFFKDAAMICIPPIKIRKDEHGRLHSMSEASIKWKDDQNDHFIHGVNFEKSAWEKITKRELKIKEILQIQNIEQRNIAIQIYGYETLIEELGAKLVNKSQRGNELYVIRDTLINGRSLKILKYKCPSTDRLYHSFVPDDMYNADHAMAWKFNLNSDEYAMLEIEA